VKQLLQSRLASLHRQLINDFSGLSEAELCTQYHPDLSQLGWHLAHIAFIEHYWLYEVVLGDDSRTADRHENFFPELIDKPSRGKLPGITDMQQLQKSLSESEKCLRTLQANSPPHHLLKDDYIGWFLLQHGEQHYETMQMVLFQKALAELHSGEFEAAGFDAAEPALPGITVAAGNFEAGCDDVQSCDNEHSLHTVRLQSALLCAQPVSNAEYLGFIDSDGYQRKELWSTGGWQWKQENRISAPEFWRQDEYNGWYQVTKQGAADLDPDAPVSGLSWYEADAFARYAGARLPHEIEWESAMKAESGEGVTELWGSTGQAWEWCANTFYPYNGFKAFPYSRYSTPWFDGQHFTLRGSSPFTGEATRRPSFRNFYQPGKRHIFAGLRLASDC
jgi:iron(II)-dependent oxidoreductase